MRWSAGGSTYLFLAITPVLFVAGLLNNPPWRGYAPARHVETDTEPVRIAFSLLRKGDFADPFLAVATGPTAHIAPGLPFLQSAILRWLGDGRRGWLALRFVPALALSSQLALLPWLSPVMGFTRWAGLLASLFGLLVKPELEDKWEAHIAGLLILLLIAAACRWQSGDRSGRWAAVIGGIAALTFYFQPVSALPYGVWILWSTRGRRFGSRGVLPLWLVPLVLVLPWVVRGYVEMGGVFPVRDNLGTELYVSFNDCASYGFRANIRNSCLQQFHPNSSADEAEAVRSMGEYRYNRDRLAKALSWIGGHPNRAAALVLRRIWYFWFPSENGIQGYPRQRIRMTALHLMTILSFLGLYCIWKQGFTGGPLLLVWTALFPLIYYAVAFDYRYRYPMLWTTWLLAAWALMNWFEHNKRFRRSA